MTATLLSQTGKITRQELQLVPVPQGTSTHQPLSHYQIVEALLETLGFRRIEVVRDEYAVSHDGMRMFGVLDLELGIAGVRSSIGIRNANDKSMRWRCVSAIACWSATIWRSMAISRRSSPSTRRTSAWSMPSPSVWIGCNATSSRLPGTSNWSGRRRHGEPQLIITRRSSRANWRCRGTWRRPCIELYSGRRTRNSAAHGWSLSNAFTSAFKELDAVPQFRATAKLGTFLERVV